LTSAPPECSACPGWAEKARDLFNLRGTFRIMEREQIAEWLKNESERLDEPALYAAAERILAFAHKVKR
jgi:hypothetical protein